MNVLVIYNSRTGNTQQAAEAIAQAVRDQNHLVTVKSVSQIQKADVENAEVLFVGTWVQGLILFRVRPAGAELWVPTLPSLAGKPVGIFCTYAFHPRGSLDALGRMLEEKGATIMGQHAFHQRNPDNGAAEFAQRILQSAEQTLT